MQRFWALIVAFFLVTLGLIIPETLSASSTTTTTTTTTTIESNPDCQLPANYIVIQEVTMNNCTFSNSDFDGISVEDDSFINTTWINLQAVGAMFASTNFSEADFQGGNFSGADIEGDDFVGANLSQTNFTNANFEFTKLTDANLAGVNLSGAELSQATLTGVVSSGITGIPASLPTGWTLSDGVLLGPGATTTTKLPPSSCETGFSNQSHNLEVKGSGSNVTVSFWRTSRDASLRIMSYKIYVGQTGSGEPGELQLPFYGTSCSPISFPVSSSNVDEQAYFPNLVRTFKCSSTNKINCQRWYISESLSGVPNSANQLSVFGYDAKGNVITYMYATFNPDLAAAQISWLGIPLPINEGQLCGVAALGLPIAQTVYVADDLALSLISNIPGPAGKASSFGHDLVSAVAVTAGVNGDGTVATTMKQKIKLSSSFLKGYAQDNATNAVKAALDQAIETETRETPASLTFFATGANTYQVVSTVHETIDQTESLISSINSLPARVASDESVCASLSSR